MRDYIYNESEKELMLRKPLRWIQLESNSVNDNRFNIVACYLDGTYKVIADFYRDTEDECDKYRRFKKHYLVENKLKFGEKCRYKITHLDKALQLLQ